MDCCLGPFNIWLFDPLPVHSDLSVFGKCALMWVLWNIFMFSARNPIHFLRSSFCDYASSIFIWCTILPLWFVLLLHYQRYLNKKKAAEEMVQHYEKQSSVDYSLKEGETLVLQLKNVSFHLKVFWKKMKSESLLMRDCLLTSKLCKTRILDFFSSIVP